MLRGLGDCHFELGPEYVNSVVPYHAACRETGVYRVLGNRAGIGAPIVHISFRRFSRRVWRDDAFSGRIVRAAPG